MTRTTTTDLLAAVADIAAAGTAAADPAAAGTVADAAALTAAADPAAADSAAAGTAPDIAAAGTVADAADLTAAAGSLGSMGGLFSTTVLYALACGIAVGGGLALLAVAVRGLPAKPEHEKQKASARAAELIRFAGQRGSLAAIVGLAVLLLTRWTVAGVAAAVLVFFWDRLFGGAAEERAAMRRVEALASWTESLRDTIAGAVGLEQAIPASARAAAPVLRPHLDALVDRLRSRTPLPEALQHLADEIDDASADIIVAALILNAKLRGPGLRQVLGALAKSAREEVDMRQRVMAQRASTRRSVQIVVAVTIAFVLGLAIFNREFVEPYGTAVGQLVLACVCGLFALGFWWLRKLSTIETPERFLVRDEAAVQFVRPRTPGAAAAAGQQQAEPGHAPSLRLPHQQGRGVQR